MAATRERMLSTDALLLAAAYLHVPSRRIRALARDEDRDLKEWIALDSSRKVTHARHLAKTAIEKLRHWRAAVVAIGTPSYPPGFLQLEDPPPFLCVRGILPERGIAIVGSRTPPPAAAEFAFAFAARCGTPVISGLARGIDAAAHRGALEANLATVAYVGTGIGATYPPEHHDLEEEIVARGGAIASERLPEEAVTKTSLVHRDRLQAAHASAVILIASEIDGGAMQTMRFAKQLRRPCFALEPDQTPHYAGNLRALADGAVALPHDVISALRKIESTGLHA